MSRKHLFTTVFKWLRYCLVGLSLALVGHTSGAVKHDSSVVVGVTDSLFAGQTDARILSVAVHISGTGTDSIFCGNFEFDPTGTKSVDRIKEARIYYLGNTLILDAPLNKSDQMGNKGSISTSSIVFSDSLKLPAGTHYFILAYDLSDSVPHLDSFGAEMKQMSAGGATVSPSIYSTPGLRVVSTFMSSSYCSVGRKTTGTITVGISKVSIDGVWTNYTSNQDGYTFFRNSLPIYKSTTYPIELKVGPLNTHYAQVWVDWDGDGHFENDELLLSETGIAAGGRVTDSLKVPCFVNPGPKRLRIIAGLNSSTPATACDSTEYGSIEDYVLWVQREEAPDASFVPDTTTYIGGQALLEKKGNTFREGVVYSWDLDSDGLFDTVSQKLQWAFHQTGYQKVSLKATLTTCGSAELTSIYTDSILVKSSTLAPITEFVASANLVAPETPIQLTDLSENGVSSWKWKVYPEALNTSSTFSFINGTSDTSKAPELVFHKEGTYSIALTVLNLIGRDTTIKLDYITVRRPASFCGKEQNHSDTLTQNTGIIYDDGGPDNDYGQDLSCTILIQPICADRVHLDLDVVDISRWTTSGNAGDWLRIYDGTSTLDSALHTKLGYSNGVFNPNNAPSSLGTVTANSGSMLLQFETDDISEGEGFKLEYHITPKKITLPTLRILGHDTVFVNSIANYSNSSKEVWIEEIWDFDDDGIPDGSGNHADFTWSTTGKKRIGLYVNGCSQKDTLFKTIRVVKPTSRPDAAFDILTPNITRNDTLFLLDRSTNGPTAYRWSVEGRLGYRFVNGTHASSKNPILLFDSLGTYSIKLWVKNSLGSDSLLRTNSVKVRDYCTPSVASQLGDLGISKVVLRDLRGNTLISQSSSEVAGYTDFSKGVRANVTPGERYIFSIERRNGSDKMQRSIWIDLDQDGFFSKSEQLVFEKASNTLRWTDTLLLPKSSITGLSRLRVGANAANQTDLGCGPHLSGEFEDYGLMVIPDQKPPELVLNGKDTVTIELCRGYREPGFSATDNVQGNLTHQVIIEGKVDTAVAGNYELRYRVKDSADNETIVSRWVTVLGDTSRPVVHLVGSETIRLHVFDNYTDAGITFFDSCSGILKIDTISNLNNEKLGGYEVKYRAWDVAGNSDSVSRRIEVYDAETPTFAFLDNTDTMYIEVFDTYLENKWEAKDNYDQSPDVTITGTVNTNVPDTYYVNYSIIDSSGNGPVSATRVVFVADSTKPVIVLPTKQVEIEVGRRVNLPIPQVTDNFDPNPVLEVLGSYDRDFIGSYTIRYVATDMSQNVADTADLIVVVYDDIPPNLSLIGAPLLQVCRWSEYKDPGINYSDNYNLQSELTFASSYFNASDEPVTVDAITQSPGYYSAFYEVIDESDNASRITRIIEVVPCNNALAENKYQGVLIYPNPAHEWVTVVSEKDIENIWVVDALGKEYPIDVGGKGLKELAFSIAPLTNGVYFVKVETPDGLMATRLLVQH